MTLVLDASALVAALIDDGPVGRWAEDLMAHGTLVAPHHLHVEAANVLHRAALAGDVSPDVAALAHRDLVALRIELFPYTAYAERVWELRSSVTAYDASYVALAELLDAELATLDRRLSKAPGVHGTFRMPPR